MAVLASLARLLGAIAIGLGLAAAGWFVGEGLRAPPPPEAGRITAQGTAERDVRADLAVWPLRFVVTGDYLTDVRAAVGEAENAVRKFVTDGGLDPASLTVSGVEVSDVYALPNRTGQVAARYIARETLLLRTGDVDKVAALARRAGDLLAVSVALSGEGPTGAGPVYLYTKAEEERAELEEGADRDAKAAAEKLAQDGGAQLGGLLKASRGALEILPQDEVPGVPETARIEKRLRMTTTVEYALRSSAGPGGRSPLNALAALAGWRGEARGG
jgi:hypothetical protein